MNINQIWFQVLLIFGGFVLSQSALAQVFEIKNVSKRYDVKITTSCTDRSCDGQANIDLYLNYLQSDIPADPWGRPYIYEFPGRLNPAGYDLRSMGPDGQPNTADDIVNGRVAAN